MRIYLIVMVALLASGAVSVLVADEGHAQVGLNYTDDPIVKVADVPNPMIFNFTVGYNGTAPSANISVQLESVPPMWSVFFAADPIIGPAIGSYSPDRPLEFRLDRNEVCNLTMTISYQSDDINKTYWFNLTASLSMNPGVNESFIVGVAIPQRANFWMMLWDPPPNDEFLVMPSSSVNVTFALYNTGNGVDQFLIQGFSSRALEGWTLRYIHGIDEYGLTDNLDPDPSMKYPYYIDINVAVPAGTDADMEAIVRLNATSLVNVSFQRPPAVATVRALQYFNFQMYITESDPKEVIPGETGAFQVKINNYGNGPDTFSLKVVFDEVLNPDFVAFADPSSVTIEANDIGTGFLVVEVPEDAPKKTYLFTLEVRSKSDTLRPVTKFFAVEVGQIYGIELTSEDPQRVTDPGVNLEFEVEVRNTGNGLDSILLYEISGAPDTWILYTQPPEVTLLQNQTADIKIIVIIPSKFEDAPKLRYTLTLRAESSRSDAEASLDLVVNITPFNRIEWTYHGDQITNPYRPSAQPGSIRPRPEIDLYRTTSVMITMGIENFGNVADEVELDVEVADTRIEVELSSSTLTVASGISEDVVITIRVRPNMTPGFYNFTVRAQSQDMSVQLRSVPLDFLVIPLFPLADFVALESTDPFGDEYTFYYEAQAKDGTTPKSSGKTGRIPGIDIVSLDATFDQETRMVTVTVLLSEDLADTPETYCYVYFVTENHAQGGPLLEPERYNGITPINLSFNGSSGVLVWWEYNDGEAKVVDAGDVPGAIPLPTDLMAQVDGNS
ncbi:MAG: hypothetical protein GQ558_05840, partial [Thermoplasmata archaeon]|nr:hypothetical protein [Thermoplasmata archaeon]